MNVAAIQKAATSFAAISSPDLTCSMTGRWSGLTRSILRLWASFSCLVSKRILTDRLPPRRNRGRKVAKNEGVDFTLLERWVGSSPQTAIWRVLGVAAITAPVRFSRLVRLAQRCDAPLESPAISWCGRSESRIHGEQHHQLVDAVVKRPAEP
jgi:hypothetical protein